MATGRRSAVRWQSGVDWTETDSQHSRRALHDHRKAAETAGTAGACDRSTRQEDRTEEEGDRDDSQRNQTGLQPRADLGAGREHGRLCGELRGLGDVLHHRSEDQGRAQSQRDRVRPAGGHADPDRIADTPAAGHPHRSPRRADRVLRSDALRGGPHLAAVVCNRVLAVPGAGVVRRRRRRLVRGRHCLYVRLVQQGAARHGDGDLRCGQRGLVAHQVHRPADHRGLRDRLVAGGSQGLCGRHAGDGAGVLVHDDSRPAASDRRAEGPQGSQAVGAADALARRSGLALRARLLLRVRRLRRHGAVAAQVLRRRIWPAAGDRGFPDDPVRPALGGHPRAGRMGVRQVGREYRHLVGHVDQPRSACSC